MKNVFYFMLKALFVLEIFSFLSWLFGYVEKRFDKKAEVHSKIYDVPDWTINNYNAKNTAILPDFRAIRQKTMRKLCLSAKCPHQEIRWNYGIFRSVTIHILPNISRSKGKQTTKFGQVIKYNVRNIFL